jgi:hypothetical protein
MEVLLIQIFSIPLDSGMVFKTCMYAVPSRVHCSLKMPTPPAGAGASYATNTSGILCLNMLRVVWYLQANGKTVKYTKGV